MTGQGLTLVEVCAYDQTQPSLDQRASRADEPTIKYPTVKRYHYETQEQIRAHLQLFVDAYNHARRLETPRGLTPYEQILQVWTKELERFRLDPSHHIPGPYTSANDEDFVASRHIENKITPACKCASVQLIGMALMPNTNGSAIAWRVRHLTCSRIGIRRQVDASAAWPTHDPPSCRDSHKCDENRRRKWFDGNRGWQTLGFGSDADCLMIETGVQAASACCRW